MVKFIRAKVEKTAQLIKAEKINDAKIINFEVVVKALDGAI